MFALQWGWKPSGELECLKDTRQHHALRQSPSLGSWYTASPAPGPSIKQEPEEFYIPQNAGSPGTLHDPIVLDINGEEEDWNDDKDTKTWPTDFYAVDIVQYFQDHKTRDMLAAQFF